MRLCITFLLLIGVLVVQGSHTFLGTSVLRSMVYHYRAEYSYKLFRKRVENLYYSLPPDFIRERRFIKGILAYDLGNSGASANITQGGLGYTYVNIKMKSERGCGLKYDIYIYT